MDRKIKMMLSIVVPLALALALVGAAPALAESSIGTNVGNELTAWAKGGLFAIAALVGIPALARRDLGQGIVVVLLTLLIGGFVYAGKPVQDVMNTLWDSVAGTGHSAQTTTTACNVTPPAAC